MRGGSLLQHYTWFQKWKVSIRSTLSLVQSPILKVGQLCWTGTVDIFVISQPKWLKFGLQAHLFKMFGHTKFQLSISCTFKVMKVFVVYLVISTKCFITMKVQEIESWNFACPNILKRCAWRPNFSHFSWEMTKISTVPVQHRCPTFSIGHSNLLRGVPDITINNIIASLPCCAFFRFEIVLLQ